MAQYNNDSIIQQFLNTSTPVQEPDPSAYDFIGQSDTAVTTPPPTEDTIARARLAFAKDTSKRNIDTAKTVLKAKKALGIDPRVAMHEQYMQGIETRNEGPPAVTETEDVFDFEEYKRLVRGAESGGYEDSNTAQNPNSSALGTYQFTEGTWNDLVTNYPGKGLTVDGRTDRAQQEIAQDLLTAENKDNLARRNIPASYGNMYVMHALGAGDGARILQASIDGNTGRAADILPSEVVTSNPTWFEGDSTPQDLVNHLSGLVGYAPADTPDPTVADSGASQESATPIEEITPPPVLEDPPIQKLPHLKEHKAPVEVPSAFKNGVKALLKKMGLPSSSAELDTSIRNFAEKYPDFITIDESVDSVDTAKQNEEAIKKFVAENPQWVSMEGVDPIVQEAEQVPEESIKTLSYQDALKKRLKEQDLQYGAKTSFRDRVLQTDTSPTFRQRILDIVKEPSMVSQSEVTNINGNVLSHGDGTYSAILDGKVISNFPTEKAAAFHAVSHAANKRILAGGGYEQWSFDDLKASLIGGAALVGEAGARLTMGDPTLNGKVREYNALKQSQKLLNDSKTDISDSDLKNYRAIRDKKILTPELEAWKKEANTLMHYGVSKFDAISKLDKEAKDNVQLSKDIEEYGNKWRKLFPENDSGWQGSQAAIDLIAAKNGDWEGIWELVKNHKMAHVKKGLGSAAYSVAIISNSLTVGAPVLTAFVLDEIRRAKIEWIEKNGEEGFTEDVESNLEWFITAKVLSQKASLGYLDKTVGAVLPGRKAWMKKSIEYIDKVTPASIKNLPMIVKKPIAIAATLGSGVAGEMVQGGLEPVLQAKAMGEKVKTLDIGKGAAAEGLGSVALGPTFAGARVAKGVYDVAKSPSAGAQTKKDLETNRDTLKADLKRIEDQEKSINPKDIANFEALQNDVKEIEEALAELPNASIDRWGQDAEPKLTSNNKVINELFKAYGPLINDNTFSIQDALNEMQQQLEEQLDGKSTELDAFEKRLPMPAGKEPTIKEKLSREYVSDLFSDKKKDTTIKVKDTQYGKQKVEEIKKLEAEIKQIEDSDISEPQKIIALDIKTKQHNKLSVQVEERASADLLKSEKQHIKNQLAKNKEQLKSDYAAGKKGSTIQEIINTQISITAGKDISDEEVSTVIKEIQDTTEYMPLDEETEYGKGDIVDLKNTDNEEVDSSQGYIIQEVLPLQEDGKVHVRLKGVDETVPVDQLINRVRTNEDPRNTLEKLEALAQRNLSDASKKLVQAEFDRLVKEYGPKTQFKEGDFVNVTDEDGVLGNKEPVRITKFLGKAPDGFEYVQVEGSNTGIRLDRLERVDSKGGRTFGSIEDSQEEINALSIDETKKKEQAAKDDADSTPEDLEFWKQEVERKIEKANRAKKEEQADKSLASVHEEILEGDSKKWKGLATYYEEIINAYKNLTDPVIRERNIRSITSKMETHAGNLTGKLAAFKQADSMKVAPGMGAVVVGSIDESSPRGVRKMNYKVQTMPLTEAAAKAEAKANGTEYKEGQSFESRKSNGQFVTLISDKAHKFENFTIKPSGGLIATLESEADYGKLIMGTVRGYKNTSMAQKAANQEIKIEAKQKVYDQLVQLRGTLGRVVTEVTEEDRSKIKVDETGDKKESLEDQLKEAENQLKNTIDVLNKTEDTDATTKETLQAGVETLKTTIAGLKARIADESTQDQDKPEGDDTTTEDQTSEKPPTFSDESTPDVRKSTKSQEGKKGEQLEFAFTGKNFIETATRMYHAVIDAASKENLDKALGLAGKKFIDLVSVGKKTTILGLQNLADTSFTNKAALAKSLEVLGVDNKAAKVLANRYFKFKTRFDKTLYHRVKEGGHVVLLDASLDAEEKLKYAGVTFLIESIDGENVTINNPNANNSKSLTVPLSEVMDVDNYAIRQPLSLLYREDNENTDNQQGTLPEQVIFSMMVGAMSWRQRTSDNNRFGDNDFKMEAFLYNNSQKLDQDEKTELGKIGYGYNDAARQIGHDISKMLHLSPEKASGELTQEGIDIYFEHLLPALGMAAIETAQGNDSEAYFIKDIHKWDFAEANVEGRIYNNNPEGSQADKDGLGYRHLKVNEDRPPSDEGLTAVSDLTAALELDIHSTAGPLQTPQDIKTNVSGTFGDVPLEVQRLMKKLHKVEWSKSQPMDIVSDLFEDHHDVLKEIMGVEELYETNDAGEYIYVLDKEGNPKLDKAGEPIKKGKWHQYDMESKEASNRDKLDSLKRLVKANDRVELDKFYFTYNLQNHHRIMQEGNINPQGSKVDRFLLKSWEAKTYNAKNLWKFQLAVAQNFGNDIDKQTFGESQVNFTDLVKDEDVLRAVHTYQKLTKARSLVESTKGKKANKTKYKNALVAKKAAAKEFADALSIVKSNELTKGGNMSLLQGIAGLSQYMKVDSMPTAKLKFKRTINTSFESDIVMEIDGISNGFAMNVMQFPMWENMPEMLAKVATYFGDDTEHDTKAPDTYQTLAEYVKDAMGDGTLNTETNKIPIEFIQGNSWKDDYSNLSEYKQNSKKYKVNKKDKGNEKIEKEKAENLLTDYNRLNKALNTLYPDFTQDANGLRNVVKYPFIIHMYGGGIDRISKDVTKDIIGEIYSRVGILQRTYTDLQNSEKEAAAFFEEYRFTEEGEQLEGEAKRTVKELEFIQEMRDFVNALEALGAFKQDNRKSKPVVTKEAFIESLRKGESFDKYFNEKYLQANISTTIAPRFNHGLKTMLEPTQAARDAIVQMGGVLHGTFLTHFKRAYENKLSEVNEAEGVNRSSLTKKELTNFIKDTKGQLIKVFPQYKGPLSTIDENGNVEGFIDLSKTQNISTLKEKVGLPEDIDAKDKDNNYIWTEKKLTEFVEKNVDDLSESANKRLTSILKFRNITFSKALQDRLKGIDKFADERVEYRTAKQNEDGTYDQNAPQTHNTFPQQLRFIEPGLAALIRQIINMDSVLLTQTMNGDPNITVNGKRWVGDVNVLMLHDAIMASPEQLSTVSEAYGQVFLHYNRTHSVMEQTYEQVKKVIGITKQLDNSAPDSTPKLMDDLEKWIANEFFDNKNKADDKKITLDDLLQSFETKTNTNSEFRRKLEETASENGGFIESLQLFMQKPGVETTGVRDALVEVAEDTIANHARNPVTKTPIAEEFNRNFDGVQGELFPDFTPEQITELKNSLNSIIAPKGNISESNDLNDITGNTIKDLFNDFTSLSGDYYNNAQEEASHTDTLSRVLNILSEGFNSTAGIQLTYEQIQGITQGAYSEAGERVTISVSQKSPPTRNGQSPQEVYTHELLHAMTFMAIDQKPLVRQRIEKLYTQVQNTLEKKYGKGQGWKVFLPANTGPTNLATYAEIVVARNQYEHAFHAEEANRLHEFLAYANTNASLSNFMKTNSVAQRTGLFGKMLDVIKLVVDTLREAFGNKVYNATDSTQFSEAIAMTEQLVAIQNKHKSKHAQIQSKTYRALDASDQIIRNFANKAFRQLQKEVGKSGPDFKSASLPLKIATGLVWLPFITLSEENVAKEIRDKMMDNMHYSLRGLAKEFGEGVLSEDMIEQLLQSKVHISKERQLAETFQLDWFNGNKANGITSIWKSLDPKKRHAMSVETREALTNVMLRTDISQLVTAGLDLESPAGMKKIIDLIGKSKSAEAARESLQKDIRRKLKIGTSSSAIQYAAELGHFMMTGNTEILPDAYTNAYSIALDHLANPTEERVALLDAYATISALNDIEIRDASLIKDLANSEFAANSNNNGIINIMQAHINFKAKSRRDLFEGDPTQMMKGYIVERMDNLTDIQIGTPEQKEEMNDRGYTYSVPLSKISADQTHTVMYVNRNTAEVKDVSGIMSTTNQRNQGTTLTEILGLSKAYQIGDTKKPNLPKIKLKIKEFKRHQNKLAKELRFDPRFKFRPVRDTNNVITDYRIMMNHKDVKEIIKPDLEFQNVFAHMHSNLVDRKNTIKNDKETIHLLVHEHENLYKAHPNQFINLLDPASGYYERYVKMPRPVREYIQEFAVDGKFMVRLYIVDKVFGYKQLDITQLKYFDNNKHPFQKRVAGLAHYAIKETVGYGKNRVVLAVPKVILGNMLSNITQLMMRKIPVSYIFNKTIEGISEYRRYSKDVVERNKLQYEIDTKNLPSNSAEAQKVERLKIKIEGNRIHQMNEAGVDSLIIEDLNEAQLDGYWNRLSRLLFKGNLKQVGDKIPRSLQTVAHTLFWTKESLPYKYSKQVVQMTDFMGRYVMMEHGQNVLGQSFKQSLHESLEAFVLFDESLIAPLEMLDAIGATAFLSYWLRNQRAVKKLVKTNPSSVAISAVVQEMTGIPTLGNVNSAWLGGDFMPNLAQTDDMFDEANNITLFEALAQIKGGF